MLELLNLVTSTLGNLALCPCPSSTLPATFPCHSINHLHQLAPHPTLSISVSTPPLSTSTSPVAPAPIPSPNVSNPTAPRSSPPAVAFWTFSYLISNPLPPHEPHQWTFQLLHMDRGNTTPYLCQILSLQLTSPSNPPFLCRTRHPPSTPSTRPSIGMTTSIRLGEHYDSHDVQMGTAGDCQRQRPPTKIFSWGADAFVRMQLYCILGTKPSGRILRLPIRVWIRPLFGLLLEMFCSALTAG